MNMSDKPESTEEASEGTAIIQRVSETTARAVIAFQEEPKTMVITLDLLGHDRAATTELARLIEQRWGHRVAHDIVDSDAQGNLLIWAHTDACMRGILRALRVPSDNQGWVLAWDHEDMWYATLLVRGSSTEARVHSSFGFRAARPPDTLPEPPALAIFDSHGYYPGVSRWVTRDILNQVRAACRAWYHSASGGL